MPFRKTIEASFEFSTLMVDLILASKKREWSVKRSKPAVKPK
jgi:hypothetical protein